MKLLQLQLFERIDSEVGLYDLVNERGRTLATLYTVEIDGPEAAIRQAQAPQVLKLLAASSELARLLTRALVSMDRVGAKPEWYNEAVELLQQLGVRQ